MYTHTHTCIHAYDVRRYRQTDSLCIYIDCLEHRQSDDYLHRSERGSSEKEPDILSLLPNECKAVVPKLFRMAAPLLNPDFPKAPSVKFQEVHFAKWR